MWSQSLSTVRRKMLTLAIGKAIAEHRFRIILALCEVMCYTTHIHKFIGILVIVF